MYLLLAAALLGQSIDQQIPVEPLVSVMDVHRVHDDQYRLIMFRTNADTASEFTVVDRAVERVDRNGTPTIRVRETNRGAASRVILYLDATTMRPLAYESAVGDTLSIAGSVDGDSIRIAETRRGTVTRSVGGLGAGTFLSSSFSELVQSNDFGRHPRITFSTLTPGAAVNHFDVERVGRRSFDHGVEVWVLQFTRTDASGTSSPAGYRYVDVQTGKVLFFATALDAPSRFSYQVLPLR